MKNRKRYINSEHPKVVAVGYTQGAHKLNPLIKILKGVIDFVAETGRSVSNVDLASVHTEFGVLLEPTHAREAEEHYRDAVR